MYWWKANTEKRQGCLGQDRNREPEGCNHHHGLHDVWQDVTQKNTDGVDTYDPGCLDILLILLGQRRAAHRPRELDPVGKDPMARMTT